MATPGGLLPRRCLPKHLQAINPTERADFHEKGRKCWRKIYGSINKESAHQHRRRVVVKNGVWFKAIYIASVLVGKKFTVVARAQQRASEFPHGVCGRKNLFSCWQISYHAGSTFVEDIPITKTEHEHRRAVILY